MQKNAAKRKKRGGRMSSSSIGKRSRKSQSPYPTESKAEIMKNRPWDAKNRKMGRYTEHIRSGVASVEDPSCAHSLRENLNDNSQMIDRDGQNKGSKT